MVQVRLPGSLILLFPGAQRRAVVDAFSVHEVIDRLDEQWPGMRDRICAPGPVIREHINVFVDGEPADLRTPVQPGSVVHVIPAVSGGAHALRLSPG